MRWKLRLGLAVFLAIAGLVGWAAVARFTAPVSNTELTRFDAIIVLGSPADPDGNPSPLLLSRISEAVREYERGVAPRLIVTGGTISRGWVEADVMARTAMAQGIPASAIVVENQALNTIQNACYSVRIMKSHGWQSAEIVSTASQLPRAGLIFENMPIKWRAHAAPPIIRGNRRPLGILSNSLETLKTIRYLVYAQHTERCEL